MWEHEDKRQTHWSYAVLYRSIRGQAYMGGGNSSVPVAITLKTLSAWEEEKLEGWDARTMYPTCAKAALRKHEYLADKGIA